MYLLSNLCSRIVSVVTNLQRHIVSKLTVLSYLLMRITIKVLMTTRINKIFLTFLTYLIMKMIKTQIIWKIKKLDLIANKRKTRLNKFILHTKTKRNTHRNKISRLKMLLKEKFSNLSTERIIDDKTFSFFQINFLIAFF